MLSVGRWREGLGVLALVTLLAFGLILGRKCGPGSTNTAPKAIQPDDFGARAAMFDTVRFTGRYAITPFTVAGVVPHTPSRAPSSAAVPIATPPPQAASPAITLVWHHDGNRRNTYEFVSDAGVHELRVIQDGADIAICSDRPEDLSAIDASEGTCFRASQLGGNDLGLDRGDLAVISTLTVANEEAYCHGSGENTGNCYSNDGVLLYAHSVGFTPIWLSVGLLARFKASGLDLFERDARTEYELKALSVTRSVDPSSFKAPYEVRNFPGYAQPDCPKATDTRLRAQFSEACVRSLLAFDFVWPNFADDYEEPYIEVSASSFTAEYSPRLPPRHAGLTLTVSKHDLRYDGFIYQHERVETIAGRAIRLSDYPVTSHSAAPWREANWTDGTADYELVAGASHGSEDPDVLLRRTVATILSKGAASPRW